MLTYNGYQIDQFNRIYHNGKMVFTAWWQRCIDLDSAKRLIDASNAAKALPDKQAALKKLIGHCELENGSQAAEQFTDWMNNEAEKQME